MRRDVFQAIADPTRREIIGLLANKSLTLNGVAENFEISRPAISKHIKILTVYSLTSLKLRNLYKITNLLKQYQQAKKQSPALK